MILALTFSLGKECNDYGSPRGADAGFDQAFNLRLLY